MAARLSPKHDKKTREKIQTSQLINRLNKNALSKEEIMTSGQIRSAEILLRKTIPDLSSQQVDSKVEVSNEMTVKEFFEEVSAGAKHRIKEKGNSRSKPLERV